MLIDRIRATGLDVALRVEGAAFPLGSSAGLTVYRIVQEALTNVLKHATAAHAWVTIRYHSPAVDVEVLDDGFATSPSTGTGHGIEGMRERAALFGGFLRAGPGPDGGLGGIYYLASPPQPGARVTTSILLVDDQSLIRAGFRMILEAEGDLDVVGEAADGVEAISLAHRYTPDVVLMDIRMPNLDGIEATRQIVTAHPTARVLALTTFDLDEYAFGALRAGASGFLLKDVGPAELVAAIRTVAAGDAVVSPRVTRRLLDEFAHLLPSTDKGIARGYPEITSLTEREREVFDAVAHGLSNYEIATRLFVSEATVKSHVGRILSKLGLRDRVQVVVLAYESGLVTPRSTWSADA